MSPLDLFYDQWIIIVANGSSLVPLAPMVPLSPLVTIGDIPFRWRFQLAYHHRMAPMEPFKWRHWSPMVIAIGSNGDRHWCQWRWGAPLAPLRPSPLEPLDRHWHHFFVAIGANGANGENPKSLWPFCPKFTWRGRGNYKRKLHWIKTGRYNERIELTSVHGSS